MTIESLISIVELVLKIAFWWEVTAFLRKLYRTMEDGEKVLEKALAELGMGEDMGEEMPARGADGPKRGRGKKADVCQDGATKQHRENLLGLARSGLLPKIGIKKTVPQLESMKDAEVESVYNEYQQRYTSCVADDLVKNLLYGYASICHWLSPGTDKEKLAKELTDNFVITAEVKKQIGQLGIALTPWLAVANAAVITARNVDFRKEAPPHESDETTTEVLSSPTSRVD